MRCLCFWRCLLVGAALTVVTHRQAKLLVCLALRFEVSEDQPDAAIDPWSGYEIIPPYLEGTNKVTPIHTSVLERLYSLMVESDFLNSMREVHGQSSPNSKWIKSLGRSSMRPDGLPGTAFLFLDQHGLDFLAYGSGDGQSVEVEFYSNSVQTDDAQTFLTRVKEETAKYVAQKHVENYQSVMNSVFSDQGMQFGLDLRANLVCESIQENWIPRDTRAFAAIKHHNVLLRLMTGRVVWVETHDDPFDDALDSHSDIGSYVLDKSKLFPIAFEGSKPLRLTMQNRPQGQIDTQTYQVIDAIMKNSGQQHFPCPQFEVFSRKGKSDLCVLIGSLASGQRSAPLGPGLPGITEYSNLSNWERIQLHCFGNYPPGTVAVYLEGKTNIQTQTVQRNWMMQACDSAGWQPPRSYSEVSAELRRVFPTGKQLFDACTRLHISQQTRAGSHFTATPDFSMRQETENNIVSSRSTSSRRTGRTRSGRESTPPRHTPRSVRIASEPPPAIHASTMRRAVAKYGRRITSTHF